MERFSPNPVNLPYSKGWLPPHLWFSKLEGSALQELQRPDSLPEKQPILGDSSISTFMSNFLNPGGITISRERKETTGEHF
jgi:hypothetical protein